MAVEVEVFEKEALAVSLAKYVADLSNKFTQQIGAFTVCLSGGSLINYLRKLSGPPYVYSIKWGKWHVFWMDKRVVPKDHEDSNYKPTFDGFLSKVKSSSILARGCRLTGELITCFDHPRSSSEPFVSDIPKASSALASCSKVTFRFVGIALQGFGFRHSWSMFSNSFLIQISKAPKPASRITPNSLLQMENKVQLSQSTNLHRSLGLHIIKPK
ncbi:6-phosphogluconolactonase 3, chloroplastic [Lathyrus oleraceus]|uniref:6-phosphogluconolactonase 3, chloroplastic n=1 Tax=Pisum sativum TaxID=3888 RepID=UPI0021D2A7B4|nr:6-phosphogluconolactonase 3, chloroplastic-like [Pisum sativum]